MKLDRRNALLGLAVTGAAIPFIVTAARAQTQPAAGGGLDNYVQQTLLLGTVAMMQSELAAQKATDPNVKMFAELEAAEQQAIASVLAATPAGQTPPEMPPERRQMIDQLNAVETGEAFDQAYIQAQIEGHNELLAIQQTASGNRDATVEAITARLAEHAIASHIAMLNLMQQMLGVQRIQNIQDGQNPDGTITPSQDDSAQPAPVEGTAPAANGG